MSSAGKKNRWQHLVIAGRNRDLRRRYPVHPENPRLIPVFMTGAVAGALVAIALGVKQTLPLPAIWGWPLATNVAGYLASVFIGALICALGVLYVSPKNVR